MSPAITLPSDTTMGRVGLAVGDLDAMTRLYRDVLLLEVLQAEGETVMLITHSVEEAIYLSSRIIVVTARPARIREVIELPFGYPRSESLHEDPRFGELRSHIRDLVMQEYAAQARQGSAVAGQRAGRVD